MQRGGELVLLKKHIDYINNGHEKKFYKSWTWKKKRKEIIDRDNGECQHCKERGEFSKGRLVHHIKHLKECPELGLADDNLITLCDECHNIMHPEKGYLPTKKNNIHRERWE